MMKIKEEPHPDLDAHEVIYRNESNKNEQEDVNYYENRTVRDQVQNIWDDIKPKIERRDFYNENRQENGVNYSDVGLIRDQVRFALGDDEDKPIIEHIDVDPILMELEQAQIEPANGSECPQNENEEIRTLEHYGDKSNLCQLCDKKFVNNRFLVRHIRFVHLTNCYVPCSKLSIRSLRKRCFNAARIND